MNQRGNILIILVLLAVLALGAVFYYYQSRPATVPKTPYSTPITKQPQPTSTSSAEQTKIYQSKSMKFTVSIPDSFQIQDTGITLSIFNQLGEIKINRNGTQFEKLSDYLENFDSTRSLQVEQQKNLTINGLESISRIQYFTTGKSDRHKIYFIFIKDAVYDISTNAESLYNDLDQIAKSFHYIP